MERVPLLFLDKQIIAVDISEAYVVEAEQYQILHTHCEVFATRDYVTNVCRRFLLCCVIVRPLFFNYADPRLLWGSCDGNT